MLLDAHLQRLAHLLGGIPVIDCLPSGPAADAGVRVGDILLSVDDIPTPTLEDYFDALQRCSETPRLQLFRDGDRIEIRLRLEHASLLPSTPPPARPSSPAGYA